MPQTKSVQNTVDKWQRRAAVAQPEYTNGIQNPRNNWAEAATAANNNYKAAVTAAASQDRYSKGVAEAGENRWKENSLRKGPARFVEGVQIAGPDFQGKIGEVLSTIQSVNLPPRGPKGSPQNYQRTQPIGDALRRRFGKTGGTTR